jgi:putative lipoic acid-binding regulatory protein
MEENKNTTEFYDRLRKQLEDDTTWPSTYLYKFIVPANLEKIAEIRSAFDKTDAEINTRDSAKGTYTSVSIKVMMDSPDAVIEKYLEVSKVDGVISL